VEDVRLRVPLGELAVALAGDEREMTVAERPVADSHPLQRLQQRDLARGGGKQVLPAQDVGDAHEGVVQRVGERVERGAVAAGEHEVGHGARLERDSAPDVVVERDVAVGHPQAEHRRPPLGAERRPLLLGEVSVGVVVAELRVAARGPVSGLDLLGRRVGLVHLACLHEQAERVAVRVTSLALPVGPVRASDLWALVPVEAEPAQHVEQSLVGLDGVAAGVGVLDAEDEGAAVVAGVRPVEQGGADQSDVRGARRRRAEADPDLVTCVHDATSLSRASARPTPALEFNAC
jgi:hypothetical protein